MCFIKLQLACSHEGLIELGLFPWWLAYTWIDVSVLHHADVLEGLLDMTAGFPQNK